MAEETVVQGVGKVIPKQIRLADGLTPSSAYLPDDVLTCSLWKGDQEAALCNPPTSWNPTLGPPDFLIDLQPAYTTNLVPSVYTIGVVVTRPSTGQTAEIWTSQIEVLPRPGTALAQPVYITLADLMTEMPSISDYQQQFRDETGFENQRAKARKTLDELIHRHIGGASISSSVFSDYPSRYLIRSTVVQEYLDNNYLVMYQNLIDFQVFLTLGMIFGGQIISNPEVFSRISRDYRIRAELALRGTTAEIRGPQQDGSGAGTLNGSLLATAEFSNTKLLRA